MIRAIKWLFGWGTAEPQQQVTRHKMELKPITSFLAPYISIEDWNKGYDKQLGRKLGWLSKTNTELLNSLSQHKQYPPKLLVLPKEIGDSNRIQAIITSIINQYSTDIFEIKKTALEDSLQYIQEMEIFAKDVNEKQYPVWIEMNEFIQTVKAYPNATDEINDLANKKKRVEMLLKTCQPPKKIDINQVVASLKNASSKYEKSIEFIQQNEFDDDLTDYIETSAIKVQFDQVLERISDFNHDIAMNQLKASVDNFYLQSIQPKISNLDQEERNCLFNILLYGSIRYTFDRVCVELPYILHNNLSAKAFLRNCEIIRRLSPHGLSQKGKEQENQHIFLKSQLHKPIEDFFMEDELLKNAVTSLNLIQFFSNPIDIAYLCTIAIDFLKKYINRNTTLNKRYGGDEARIGEIEYVGPQEMLCFDELFTVFYMALCICPPANVVAISVFIKSFNLFFAQSGALDYGSTSIRAAVDYINEFDIGAVVGHN